MKGECIMKKAIFEVISYFVLVLFFAIPHIIALKAGDYSGELAIYIVIAEAIGSLALCLSIVIKFIMDKK